MSWLIDEAFGPCGQGVMMGKLPIIGIWDQMRLEVGAALIFSVLGEELDGEMVRLFFVTSNSSCTW